MLLLTRLMLICLSLTCAHLCGQDETKPNDSPLEKLMVKPPDPDDTEPLLETVENQLVAIRAKDMPRAYFSYTARDFRRATSLGEFTQLVRDNVALSKNQAIAPDQVLIQKGLGYYSGVITATDGTAQVIHYNLVFEDAEWKILSIKLEPLKKF